MRDERTFVAQRPEELEDQAIDRWARGHQLKVIRLDERVEEVRDNSDDLSLPEAVVRLDDRLTLPYYYRVALIEGS